MNVHELRRLGLTEDQIAFEADTPEGKAARIKKRDAEAKDWYGYCRGCGNKIVGTLQQLASKCPRCGYNGKRRS